MSQKILLTGAAGFIGSSLAEELLQQGAMVVGVDCVNDYYNPKWKYQNIATLQRHSNFTFFEEDILHEAFLKRLGGEYTFDMIIHLAARAGVRPSIVDPLLYESVNVRGTLNILEMAKRQHIPKVLFASSSSVYGNRKETPFSETDRVDFPISPYAATKKATEELAFTYSHLYGISCIGLRFFTVYGPKGRPDMAPYLFTEALLCNRSIMRFGQGNSGRDYTYIDDIVQGIIGAMHHDTPYDIFNLGNSNPVLLNEFIETLERVAGKKARIETLPKQQGDVDITFADISKAKASFGYVPTTSLETGLRAFVEWYRAHRLPEIAK